MERKWDGHRDEEREIEKYWNDDIGMENMVKIKYPDRDGYARTLTYKHNTQESTTKYCNRYS